MQIDTTVSGTVAPMQQPTDMTCWATAATILYSWKAAASTHIATALGAAGDSYVSMFQANQGLGGDEKPAFLQAMGLTAEPPEDLAVDAWAQLIQSSGPLWVTTNEGGAGSFSAHARIVVGIKGDGDPNTTFLSIIDPATGTQYAESVQDFTDKFDDIAREELGDNADLRPQVVHY